MIISNLFLFGIEPDTLPNDGRLRAGGAPDSERHFETNGEDPLTGLASAISQSTPDLNQKLS